MYRNLSHYRAKNQRKRWRHAARSRGHSVASSSGGSPPGSRPQAARRYGLTGNRSSRVGVLPSPWRRPSRSRSRCHTPNSTPPLLARRAPGACPPLHLAPPSSRDSAADRSASQLRRGLLPSKPAPPRGTLSPASRSSPRAPATPSRSGTSGTPSRYPLFHFTIPLKLIKFLHRVTSFDMVNQLVLFDSASRGWPWSRC
jgi:hypothetical protein